MNDARINFVCLDYPDAVETCDSFSREDNLDLKLDQYVTNILNEKVTIDTV
jgi:hypothetical protein